MFPRLKRQLENPELREDGFTLIELLVVIIIIGILAAIAVPIFLNQRSQASDAAVKSDLRTVARGQETYATSTTTYGTLAQIIADGSDLAVSPDGDGDLAVLRQPGLLHPGPEQPVQRGLVLRQPGWRPSGQGQRRLPGLDRRRTRWVYLGLARVLGQLSEQGVDPAGSAPCFFKRPPKTADGAAWARYKGACGDHNYA